MITCNKCEHYRMATYGYYGEYAGHRCNHPEVRQWKWSPVTGDPFFVLCEEARSLEGPCGPAGRLFQDEVIIPKKHRRGFLNWLRDTF